MPCALFFAHQTSVFHLLSSFSGIHCPSRPFPKIGAVWVTTRGTQPPVFHSNPLLHYFAISRTPQTSKPNALIPIWSVKGPTKKEPGAGRHHSDPHHRHLFHKISAPPADLCAFPAHTCQLPWPGGASGFSHTKARWPMAPLKSITVCGIFLRPLWAVKILLYDSIVVQLFQGCS